MKEKRRDEEKGNRRSGRTVGRGRNAGTNLRIYQTVLSAGDENEAFDLGEVGELRWVELSDREGVSLFVSFSKESSESSEEWEGVGCVREEGDEM